MVLSIGRFGLDADKVAESIRWGCYGDLAPSPSILLVLDVHWIVGNTSVSSVQNVHCVLSRGVHWFGMKDLCYQNRAIGSVTKARYDSFMMNY
ncbi:unnamed protein product [Rhizophagus irregularis]|nr:unnamed protein product [Rhizophagus irregularis]